MNQHRTLDSIVGVFLLAVICAGSAAGQCGDRTPSSEGFDIYRAIGSSYGELQGQAKDDGERLSMFVLRKNSQIAFAVRVVEYRIGQGQLDSGRCAYERQHWIVHDSTNGLQVMYLDNDTIVRRPLECDNFPPLGNKLGLDQMFPGDDSLIVLSQDTSSLASITIWTRFRSRSLNVTALHRLVKPSSIDLASDKVLFPVWLWSIADIVVERDC